MVTVDEVYERARAANDDLVREGVAWLRSRGMGQVSAWLLATWLIQRACRDAVERAPWPA